MPELKPDLQLSMAKVSFRQWYKMLPSKIGEGEMAWILKEDANETTLRSFYLDGFELGMEGKDLWGIYDRKDERFGNPFNLKALQVGYMLGQSTVGNIE